MVADSHHAVEGGCPFPLDMLRRDRSRAATPEDQRKIDLLSREIADLGDTAEERQLFRRTPVAIDLVIPDAKRSESPHTVRRESFRGPERPGAGGPSRRSRSDRASGSRASFGNGEAHVSGAGGYAVGRAAGDGLTNPKRRSGYQARFSATNPNDE